MIAIDLNGDVGEGAGADAALLPWLSSANIACGAHAGDGETMAATMATAARLGLRVGAHPGYADRANFGRRELTLTAAEIERLVTEQLETLSRYGHFHYVKPHGALYNQAARDPMVATAVARAVRAFDPSLALMGLAGGAQEAAARGQGLEAIREGFADRAYGADGRLVSRDRPGAVLHEDGAVVAQVLSLVQERRVRTVEGGWVPMTVDSVCVHGDGERAVALATALRRALGAAGVAVRSPSPNLK